MKHLYLRLWAACLLALTAGSALADDYDLYLYAEEGETYTSLDYANLRSLSFTQTREYNADSVRVYVNRVYVNYFDDTSVAIDMADYDAFVFATAGLDTGIESVAADGLLSANTFSLSGQQLTANASGALRIYSIDGRTISQTNVQAGESVTLSGLPAGMYIINLGAQSAKILLK